MSAGAKKLYDIMIATLTRYPSIEAQIPAKVAALRAALSSCVDVEFDKPTATSAGHAPDGGRRCIGDRSIFIDQHGRAVSRINVTLRFEGTPIKQPVHLVATLTVWEDSGPWYARIDSGETLDADKDIDALGEQLSNALSAYAHDMAIDATAPRGFSSEGAGW